MDDYQEKCKSICRLVYQANHIPTYLYRTDELVYAIPSDPTTEPPYGYIRQLFSQKEPIFYTDYGTCFARLDSDVDTDVHFVLGPISTLSYGERIFAEMYRNYGITLDQRDGFQAHFNRIPRMTYLDFFYLLLTVHFMINGKEVPLTYFTQLPSSNETIELRQKQAETMYEHRETATQNNSLEVERKLLSLVRTGNIQGIQQFIKGAPSYQAGIVADNHLRLHKNYFISIITLVTRAAIDSGLSTDQAYRLSDLYITKAECLHSQSAVNTLYIQALQDFTTQVNTVLVSLRRGTARDASQVVQDCMDYVQKHTHKPLTVQNVADALGYHRSYLSTAFTKATDLHLNDYIYQCKLEESKYLLAFTSKKIGDISNSLCFSNQSHFVQRFKKLYGMTPVEYRRSV